MMGKQTLRRGLVVTALLMQAGCAGDDGARANRGDAAGPVGATDASSDSKLEAGSSDAQTGGSDAAVADAAVDASVSALDAQTLVDAQTPLDAAPKVYEVPGDGTVHDTATGLTWQQAVDPQRRSWQAAKTYCMQLTLAGAGWHLATFEELLGIVDRGRTPSIDQAAFPGTPAKDFWSSSPSELEGPDYVDGVSFDDGSTFSSYPVDLNYVRCVR